MLYYIAKFILLGPLMWLIFRPVRRGTENLKTKGPLIIVCNHWHITDPVFLGCLLPRTIHFMAKKELFQNPVLSFIFEKLMFAFPVDRGRADLSSMKKAISLLKEGKVFGIFPEGTRNVTGEMDSLEKGAAFLALKTGAKILPIYMEPVTFRKMRVHMTIGETMDPEEVSKRHPGKPVDVLTQAIEDRLQLLRIQTEGDRI